MVVVRRGKGERYGEPLWLLRVAIYGRCGGCVEFP